MTPIIYLELTAAAAGITGTVLLAMRGSRAGWGFVAFLVSNLLWITDALILRQWPFLAQQLAFLISSLIGIWVWLVEPLGENWPMVLCGHLNCLADDVYEVGANRQAMARISLRLSNAIDALALRIYLRFKPTGQKWNPVDGRWEAES